MLIERILARRGEYDQALYCPEYLDLTWQERQKRRQRVTTGAGRVVGIALPEGGGLQDGDLLAVDGDRALIVRAAPEPVLAIVPRSRREFGLVAHQIGNRHMLAWIAEDEIVVLHDPVLEHQLIEWGVPFSAGERPLGEGRFVPTAGGGHGHYHP